MSFVSGSNSALSSSNFFFPSSSSISSPSFVVDFNFFQLLHSILINGIHHVQNLQPPM